MDEASQVPAPATCTPAQLVGPPRACSPTRGGPVAPPASVETGCSDGKAGAEEDVSNSSSESQSRLRAFL